MRFTASCTTLPDTLRAAYPQDEMRLRVDGERGGTTEAWRLRTSGLKRGATGEAGAEVYLPKGRASGLGVTAGGQTVNGRRGGAQIYETDFSDSRTGADRATA